MPAPFLGKELELTQPDGSTLRVRGFGNPFEARFETLDGRPVALDPATGFYRPAAEIDAPALALGARAPALASGLLRRRTRWEERRAEKKAAPERPAFGVARTLSRPDMETVGDSVGLCLLIEFPDSPATIPREEVEAFCNQRGYSGFGNRGSVFDYFLDNSAGKLRYTNIVAPYYKAKHPRAHYTDVRVRWPQRATELIREALEHHRSQGLDLAGLTKDNRGFLRALNVFYSGALDSPFQKGLWPHSFQLSPTFKLKPGLVARDYQITDMGLQLTLGTFCHENGHMVCDFPDLYDVGPESFGTGFYCLMGYGGTPDPTNPIQVCAYLKHQAGWTENVIPITPGQSVTLNAGKNEFAIFERNATEYFILENRQRAGRDGSLPGSGLAIWHVDEKGSNENQQRTKDRHYECSLEQADGLFNLETKVNAGDANDLFPIAANGRFGAATQPDSRWWDGTPSGLEIRNIRREGSVMTFEVGP